MRRGWIAAVAAAMAAVAVPWYWLRRSLPRYDGVVRLGGLDGAVEIVRDRWAVPHIFARTAADLFFGQGYATAQDRLWQVELGRRVASGSLAELVGPQALDTDRLLRRLGFRRAAAAEWEQLDAEARLPVDAYCAGVNAWILQVGGRLPVEFALLRTRPVPWTPLDCLAFAKYMAFGQAADWQTKWLRGQAVAQVGAEQTLALEPFAGERPPRTLHVPPGLDYGTVDYFLGGPRATVAPAVPPVPTAPPMAASNGWAVAPSRTVNGGALLANDPHLAPHLPCPWYEIHLAGAGYDVIGASLPPAPGVIIGRNRRIAWGITAAMLDANDLYIERCDPTKPAVYTTAGGKRERTEVIEEHIAVKGWSEPVIETVRVTRHGPIINPPPTANGVEAWQLALHSTVLTQHGMVSSLLALNRAGAWDEFRAALAGWPAPPLNFVYADVDGHIGRQCAGRVPVRVTGDGLLPVPGWDDAYEWAGLVPFADLPSEFDPPRGYVVAANHDVRPPDYPHHLGDEWLDPYRARRIDQLLAGADRLDQEACRQMQADTISLAGQTFVAAVLALRDRGWLVPEGRSEVLALDFLARWDGSMAPESAGAAVYTTWRRALLRHLYAVELGDLASGYLGIGPHPVIAPTNTNSFRHSRFLVERLAAAAQTASRQDGHDGFTTDDGLRAALTASFRAAVAELRQRAGDDPARWRLSTVHGVTFAHAFGTQRVIGRLFNRGPLSVPGDNDTIFASPADPAAPYDRASAIPSYRLIVDFGTDQPVGMPAGGQSGHPFSRNYADRLGAWRRADLHPLPYDRAAIQRQAHATLRLIPESATEG